MIDREKLEELDKKFQVKKEKLASWLGEPDIIEVEGIPIDVSSFSIGELVELEKELGVPIYDIADSKITAEMLVKIIYIVLKRTISDIELNDILNFRTDILFKLQGVIQERILARRVETIKKKK